MDQQVYENNNGVIHEIKHWFLSWHNEHLNIGTKESFLPSKNILLISGPIHSGKSFAVNKLIEDPDIQQHFHFDKMDANDTIEHLQKRLRMKDVRYMFSTPVYVFDPLDSVLVIEKGILTGMVEVLKGLQSREGTRKKCILLFVCSSSVQKRLGELKKMIAPQNTFTLGLIEDKIDDGFSARDSVIYDTSELYKEAKSWIAYEQFLSMDPWLASLTMIDDIRGNLKESGPLIGLLSSTIQWGILSNIDTDDFGLGDVFYISTAFIAMSIYMHVLKGNHCTVTKGSGSCFTKLLTLHSIRKRVWKEKYDSGLPWVYDQRGVLGSKFSTSTLKSIYGTTQ